ncbi:hypothetical protein DICSQDRAFT_151874 [Dichomitus squalens LYAD-421 SS1]|uniref:uncharacterized protein n=1 Tax=Dichomitus squalens (strain LYAD-421) TaxID=732165 RepID=UPI000441302C|nr:uncharacterized protein DICSQDRAFT_151874 [Dichomitus squalens LYAD-421 SS1]EJF65813.1 hypothetical protein DICSQDRAFT_151874 [Dichomitus squalens LYAD-421 SS1]
MSPTREARRDALSSYCPAGTPLVPCHIRAIDLTPFVGSSSIVFPLLPLICHDTPRPVICPSADFLVSFPNFPSPHVCVSPGFGRASADRSTFTHPVAREMPGVSSPFAMQINLDVLLPRASAVRDSIDTSGNTCLERTQCTARLPTRRVPKPHPTQMGKFDAELFKRGGAT